MWSARYSISVAHKIAWFLNEVSNVSSLARRTLAEAIFQVIICCCKPDQHRLGQSFNASFQKHKRANFALELTRGPFLGAGKSNSTASRWLHIAPSEALVSRAASVPR